MKDHIKDQLKNAVAFTQVKAIVDDYMDYYNNERYQWHLAKLAPNEYYQSCTTGEYPLKIPTPPEVPAIQKKPAELGKKQNPSKTENGTGKETEDGRLNTQTSAETGESSRQEREHGQYPAPACYKNIRLQ